MSTALILDRRPELHSANFAAFAAFEWYGVFDSMGSGMEMKGDMSAVPGALAQSLCESLVLGVSCSGADSCMITLEDEEALRRNLAHDSSPLRQTIYHSRKTYESRIQQ